jgi:hypothetical protein
MKTVKLSGSELVRVMDIVDNLCLRTYPPLTSKLLVNLKKSLDEFRFQYKTAFKKKRKKLDQIVNETKSFWRISEYCDDSEVREAVLDGVFGEKVFEVCFEPLDLSRPHAESLEMNARDLDYLLGRGFVYFSSDENDSNIKD